MAPRLCTSKARVDLWQLTRDDITMAIAPHAGGAAGTLTFFAAPLVGAKTVMLEEFDPKQALAVMEREGLIGPADRAQVRLVRSAAEAVEILRDCHARLCTQLGKPPLRPR